MNIGLLSAHVPRVVLDWSLGQPPAHHRAEGSLIYVDISGFTALSERLGRQGRAGAEEVTQLINGVIEQLLPVAYADGATLLKFGGDSMIIFISGEDHPARAARAAHGMQRALAGMGRIATSAGDVTLQMTIGIHSGEFDFFLAGDSHAELIVTGPAATQTVAMEVAAQPGEILVSAATAAALGPSVLGVERAGGRVLRKEPSVAHDLPSVTPLAADGHDLGSFVPTTIREHLEANAAESELRQAVLGFIRFGGVEEMLAAEGTAAVAAALHELVRTVQRACAEYEVTFVLADIAAAGGSIFLVAGAPRTMGQDEERMLRLAREVVDTGLALPVQIGIHRGHVFCGDVGTSFRRSYTIMGDAVNLAARLAAAATPGAVLATPDVLERSRIVFAAERLEPLQLKGKAEPVETFGVGGVLGSRRSSGDGVLPLVGRDREAGMLSSALAAAAEGRGDLVELVGEAGMGKSRLVAEIETLAGDGARVFMNACEPYESSTPYSAFRGLMRQLLAVDVHGTPEQLSRQLGQRLEQDAPELIPWIPLLALPLDVTVLPTRESSELDPAFRKQRLHAVVRALLARLLGSFSVLVFEDVHWMDEASSDLLRALSANLAARPWLVAVTRRPATVGFAVTSEVPAITVHLHPLNREASAELARVASGDAPLPVADIEALANRSAGNPLFLRELVRSAQAGAGAQALPESVEAVIAARIDRLSPRDRLVLRYASVLGPNFSHEIIARTADEEASPVNDLDTWDRLTEFIDSDLFGSYRFRHALIRDVAYEGLPFRRRRELHQRVGLALEEQHGERAGEHAELLSLHFLRAQLPERAWRYSLLAGERAQRKFANLDAAQFYRRALDAGRDLPDLPRGEVARVWEALGDVSELAARYEDAAGAYRTARRLAAPGQDVTSLLLKEGMIRERSGNYREALRWYGRAMKAVEGIEDPSARSAQSARVHLAQAATRHRQGRFEDCITWCRRAIAEAEVAGARAQLAHGYTLLHLAHTTLGLPARAEYRELALPIYEELDDPVGQANVLNNLGVDAYFEGRWEEALRLWQRSRDARERVGDVAGAATALNNIAEIYADQGRLEEAEPLLTEVLGICRQIGSRLLAAVAESNLGRLAARAGEFERAETMLRESGEGFNQIGAANYILETEARLAELALFRGDHGAAFRIATLAAEKAAAGEGNGVLKAFLQRIRGYAILQAGDVNGVAESFYVSLSLAREANASFEIAQTLVAQAALAQRIGASDGGAAAEAEKRFAQLGVMSSRAVPLPSP